MEPPEFYRGREQTYLKHYFLENYLARLVWNVGSFRDEFVYFDGFAGPWRSESDDFEDTSPVIAIRKLTELRRGLAEKGKQLRVRCIFVESDPKTYPDLQRAVQIADEISVETMNCTFTEALPAVLPTLGRAFTLTFIDPTGWTGFPLRVLTPLLQRRSGEVLINFMFDFINRFIDAPQPELEKSLNDLFGGPGWRVLLERPDREDAILDFYRERVRAAGSLRYVTATRIKKPEQDRAYFHLVYVTGHPKGLVEFRKVEQQAAEEEEKARLHREQENRIRSTGTGELFTVEQTMEGGFRSYGAERAARLAQAREWLRGALKNRASIPWDEALPSILEIPMVWDKDVKALVKGEQEAGRLSIRGLKAKERVPKLGQGHVLVARHMDADP
ncbi:MAG: three-Cys-motif partner protein TcmP [Polyangiaceae bacterium]|nr:three-Cys-motif partner protein TcmP [Polyangiaceae bacterium]